MHDEPSIGKYYTIGALIGSSVRARMLTVLFDGRALTATELSNEVGVVTTACEHLGLLLGGGLVSRGTSGRHQYSTLASPVVTQALESLVVELSPV